MTALILPEILDRTAATALAQQLMDRRGAALALDASAVTRIGGLGAEVLLTARRQWQADGHPFQIDQWSPDAAAALTLLGAEVLQ